MRKLATFVALLFLLFFVNTPPTFAQQCQYDGLICQDPARPTFCFLGLREVTKCCISQQACDFYKTTDPATRVDPSVPVVSQVSTICDSVSDPGACNGCMADGNHVWTAIGCVSVADPSSFLTDMLKMGMGIAGGIAFLLILFGGLQILTSAGNPEQLNAGRELVSAAITGLLLVVFSIFLLQFMGVSILGIPGFQ